jgi:hypothetical protein
MFQGRPLGISKETIDLGNEGVIGAANQINCCCNNDAQRGCGSSRFMTCLNGRNYLYYPEVYRAQWMKDTKQVKLSATIGKPSIILNAGLTETRKYIAPENFTEATFKRWTLEADKRNPNIMIRYRGIKISQCAYHSRYIRLINLLGTETMRQWWYIFKDETADSEENRNIIGETL